MIKYITAFTVAILMLGCEVKTMSPKVNITTKQQVTPQKVNTVVKTIKKPMRMSLPEGFKEVKKLRPLKSNVPKDCKEWSDGCNVCTRAGNHKASCTVYTCEKKAPFSCLKWQ